MGGILLIGLAGCIVLNILAFNHAKCMLVYQTGGLRTHSPEKLNPVEKVRILLAGVNIPKPGPSFLPSDFDLSYSQHTIPVNDNIRLDAWYIPTENSRGLIIMFHGYSSEKSAMLKETTILHRLGYTCLLVDFRGSGDSSESYTTLGYIEAEDVSAAYTFAREQPGDQPIILFGQSMGAAAILRAVQIYGIAPDASSLEAVFDYLTQP